MTDPADFAALSPTTFADVLPVEQVMAHGIRSLWPAPRVAGPAFPVVCPPGDNLMAHAAVYRAAPGSIVVVQAGDERLAVIGGNVARAARDNGIAAMIVDGVVRDLAEIRDLGLPVFARGVSPKPGVKKSAHVTDDSATCGGVVVSAGDMVIADEEGAVVVPAGQLDRVLEAARHKGDADAAQSFEQWRANHRATVSKALQAEGFEL